jgi:hypothetical protein
LIGLLAVLGIEVDRLMSGPLSSVDALLEQTLLD